ncbi:hypothetical protein V6N11_014768 [Hibiscus sabdariffa]|uniref:Uncharacterized protein n=1 Tax=Hibiscus sabdariffa TaxID=183260 RepID=A0ABR2TQ22_9ROSI
MGPKRTKNSAKGGVEKLPNETEAKKNKKHEKITAQKTTKNVGGCCQGANGFTCCMTTSSEPSEKERIEEPSEVSGKFGMCKLTRWVDSLEQHNVLTTTTVVGAIVTIVVAYSYYRRSG